MCDYLLEKDADINLPELEGEQFTPLMIACKINDPENVKLLLEWDSDTGLKCAKGTKSIL